MRRIHYRVAVSVDGYISGPGGSVDWILHDPDLDFGSLFDPFDAVLLGRRTYEMTQAPGAPPWPPGILVYVFSRTLRPGEHPHVTMVSGDACDLLTGLKAKKGKDIWLFGGASLFRSLLDQRLVDRIELAVMPVLLGGGTPLLEPPANRVNLKLTGQRSSKTGIVSLEYAVT